MDDKKNSNFDINKNPPTKQLERNNKINNDKVQEDENKENKSDEGKLDNDLSNNEESEKEEYEDEENNGKSKVDGKVKIINQNKDNDNSEQNIPNFVEQEIKKIDNDKNKDIHSLPNLSQNDENFIKLEKGEDNLSHKSEPIPDPR